MKRGTRASLLAIPRKTIDVTIDVPADVNVAGPAGVLLEPITFTLREMSGTERDRFMEEVLKDDNKVDKVYLRARLVSRCLVDENGERMFADDEIDQLSDTVASSALEALFAPAQKLNGLDPGAAETAAKNSESGPASASTSS